jgi:hypothetical protein
LYASKAAGASRWLKRGPVVAASAAAATALLLLVLVLVLVLVLLLILLLVLLMPRAHARDSQRWILALPGNLRASSAALLSRTGSTSASARRSATCA